MRRRKQTEFEVLQRVADEYRRMGYSVIVQPELHHLPPFLHGIAVGAIAEKEDEHVVIAVKSSAELHKSDSLVVIANALKAQPGWRVDLIAQPLQDDLRDLERYQRRYDVLSIP